MKIMSCISSIEEIEPLKKAGADEIYFGYKKIANFSNGPSLNNIDEIKFAIEQADKLGLKKYLAINDTKMSPPDEKEENFYKNLKEILNLNIDGFIVSNIGILNFFKKNKIKKEIHLSSTNPIFNLKSAEFFYENFNISRIIFPNQLSAFEAENIISFCKKNKIKTEIFYFKFFGCPYINGFCYMHHGKYCSHTDKSEGSLCRVGYKGNIAKIKPFNVDKGKIKELRETMKKVLLRASFGGAPRLLNVASFFDYYLLGVETVKFGTRTDSLNVKVEKIKTINKALKDIKKDISKYNIEKARDIFLKKYT